MLLAGDVGGTKVDLGIFSEEDGRPVAKARARYASASYPGLGPILAEFLESTSLRVDRACFAVAGPVIGDRANLTNLSWVVDRAELAEHLGIRAVHLMNDVEALATGVLTLTPTELHTLNRGAPASQGAIAVIAPGTGLGQSFLTWTGTGYRAHPSEGGHADFAPGDELQVGLLEFLRDTADHVSVEQACSGKAIPTLYEYLRRRGAPPESPAFATLLAEASDRTRAIIEGALTQPHDPLAFATVELFVSVLGAEAGNLALKVLATGGVYVGGGIPRHMVPALDEGRFMRSFARKGRLEPVLRDIPVHVVLVRTALIGAATVGLGLTVTGSRERTGPRA